MTATKKITKATFKSFIKKNQGNLLIKFKSHFDGMTDGIEFSKNPQFVPVKPSQRYVENTLGIEGVWLVGSSRDSFRHYEDSLYIGIEYYNCCGGSVLAIEKEI